MCWNPAKNSDQAYGLPASKKISIDWGESCACTALQVPLLRQVEAVEAAARRAANEPHFDLNSPKDVCRVLFTKLRLVPPPSAKQRSSANQPYSTTNQVAR